MEEHVGHVWQVLNNKQIMCQGWKMGFHANSVPFLGLIIQGGNVKAYKAL